MFNRSLNTFLEAIVSKKVATKKTNKQKEQSKTNESYWNDFYNHFTSAPTILSFL